MCCSSMETVKIHHSQQMEKPYYIRLNKGCYQNCVFCCVEFSCRHLDISAQGTLPSDNWITTMLRCLLNISANSVSSIARNRINCALLMNCICSCGNSCFKKTHFTERHCLQAHGIIDRIAKQFDKSGLAISQ